jgi:phytoene synthase
MAQGATRIREDARALTRQIRDHGLDSTVLSHVLNGWVKLVEESVGQELHLRTQDIDGGADNAPEPTSLGGAGNPDSRPEAEAVRALLRNRAASISTPESRLRYFGHHSKSFRFAARWFSRRRLQEVADVYAFCRFTDDLVDEEGDTATTQQRSARLAEWGRMAKEAYEGIPTGTPGLDQVMETMRNRGISFTYARELIRGVEMDLNPTPFPTLQSLRVYSYRVASVVGEWITQLFGIDDPWMLERARALGHAMQLTNILRDVGEDLRQGRLYLPEDRMEAHGVDRRVLQAKMAAGTPALPGYRNLVEELMADAEANYDRAFEAIPRLPRPLRTAVAVAASVYQGIHEEIRKNRYDNLTRRAHTSFFRKVVLASRGLWRLRGKVERRSRAGAWRTVLALVPAMLWAPPALAQDPGNGTMAQDEGVPSISTQWASTYLETLGDPSAEHWTESGLRLERIRALYHLAVEEKDDTEAFADSLKLARSLTQEGSPLEVALAGYGGALQIVRAKHARWPPNKLKHLDRGAATLDSLVAAHPDHLEVRYLRFASYRFLPFFLRRDEAVADDEEVLAQSLVNRPQAFSDHFHKAVVGFVLAYGSLDQEQQARLAQVVSRRR